MFLAEQLSDLYANSSNNSGAKAPHKLVGNHGAQRAGVVSSHK